MANDKCGGGLGPDLDYFTFSWDDVIHSHTSEQTPLNPPVQYMFSMGNVDIADACNAAA